MSCEHQHEIAFQCPNCGCSIAEEYCSCDGVISEVTNIHEDGLEYKAAGGIGEILNCHYECQKCGYTLPDEVCTAEDFIQWCKDNPPKHLVLEKPGPMSASAILSKTLDDAMKACCPEDDSPTEYKVVSYYTDSDYTKKMDGDPDFIENMNISTHLVAGWKLYGQPYMIKQDNGDIAVFQPMVRRKHHESI